MVPVVLAALDHAVDLADLGLVDLGPAVDLADLDPAVDLADQALADLADQALVALADPADLAALGPVVVLAGPLLVAGHADRDLADPVALDPAADRVHAADLAHVADRASLGLVAGRLVLNPRVPQIAGHHLAAHHSRVVHQYHALLTPHPVSRGHCTES